MGYIMYQGSFKDHILSTPGWLLSEAPRNEGLGWRHCVEPFKLDEIRRELEVLPSSSCLLLWAFGRGLSWGGERST